MKRAALLMLLLAGCTVGPDYVPPRVQSPGAFGAERTDVSSGTMAAPVDPAWWRAFGDPVLTGLVERAARQNLSLAEAAERVLQARAERRVVRAQGLPQVNGRSDYMRQRLSPTGETSQIEPAPGGKIEFDVFENGLNSSWDLDLFGRVRREVEAAGAQAQAAVADRRGVALATVADTAQDYLELRGVQAERRVAERNLELARENTGLVGNRLGNGVATRLDLARAQAQEATIAATLPPLRVQEAALINALGLLLGEPPRALERELRPDAALPPVPTVVGVGMPASLLRRRPDLQAAEARLHAATAEVGVATAAFYPDISLAGSFELQGLRVRDAFSLYSRAFQVGPTVSVPIFQGGRLQGTLELRESQARAAAIAFRRTLLQAWTEVDDALTRFAEAQAATERIAAAAAQNELALRLSRQRFAEGAVDFLDVNNAQAQLLQTQDQLAQNRTRIATALVGLYRALGGGWEIAG